MMMTSTMNNYIEHHAQVRVNQRQNQVNERPTEPSQRNGTKKRTSNKTTLYDVVDNEDTVTTAAAAAAAVLTNHKNIIVTLNTIAVRSFGRSSPRSHLHLQPHVARILESDLLTAEAGQAGRRAGRHRVQNRNVDRMRECLYVVDEWWTEPGDLPTVQTALALVHSPNGIHFR